MRTRQAAFSFEHGNSAIINNIRRGVHRHAPEYRAGLPDCLRARLMPIQTAGASVVSSISRIGSGIFSRAVSCPACGKMALSHNHRRTAHNASENVVVVFPGHTTPPTRSGCGNNWNNTATTLYKPSRHGPARNTVLLHQPHVLSKPKQLRDS